ncbi:hypothetical protein QUW40_09475 [Collinsella tanakaei]|uniref:hypothetical protein n=1 Tax=Collinsella tanakaei TaxID=626935 RepID=UPI0025A4B298|nr:hypothetical protein [Collinsella tanakaei]MDM8246826.1 hypothetical protein [Collinsella tanakaei]
MPLEYIAILLGAGSILLGFAPLVPIQVIGVALGIAGIITSRRAVRADYRRDLPATVGLVASIAGIVVSGITPLFAVIIAIVQAAV